MRATIVFLLFNISVAYTQNKVEREYKIRPSDVPAKALNFLRESVGDTKINWYMEENSEGKSIEGKIRKDKTYYSVEFDTLGNIQDIEVLVKFSDIPETLRNIIDRSLKEEFSKFKIRKTQKQWIGDATDLQLLMKGAKPDAKHILNYEIVLMGRKDKHRDEYELLFNEDGMLIRQQKIIESNQQHLIF
jgi:hypothetical protein